MNWAKGRATRGRGTSFKGALSYALHDKGASTTDRVGFIELSNLATDNPGRAWSEMMALCDAADDLKKRTGIKATGRKMTKPVYAFTLNWHEADKPDAAHMRDTAREALKALGMGNLQAVIIEHTDRPHKHVHVIVNLVDPDTGKAVSLSNDDHKLDRWADDYEQKQGVIRSPDRRAKFHALDNGLEPPKRGDQAKSREEWQATRKAQGERARQRAAEIRAAYAEHVAGIKARHNAAFQTRKAEMDRLWKRYSADRKAVTDRYQPFIDAIWKSRRKAPPHSHTEQALRDLEETAEWKELGRAQFKQRRQFSARERSMLGVIVNIIRLRSAGIGAPGLTGLFKLMVSGNERRRQFDKLQETDKLGLRQRQATTRKIWADTLSAARRHEQAQLSETFKKERGAMLERHAAESAGQRADWRKVATEREKVWSDYRRDYPEPAPQREEAKRRPAASEHFRASASRGQTPEDKPAYEQKADRFRENAADITTPAPDRQAEGGWRARRSADERRADGSYRPRNRDKGRTPDGTNNNRGGRGRERGR